MSENYLLQPYHVGPGDQTQVSGLVDLFIEPSHQHSLFSHFFLDFFVRLFVFVYYFKYLIFSFSVEVGQRDIIDW